MANSREKEKIEGEETDDNKLITWNEFYECLNKN